MAKGDKSGLPCPLEECKSSDAYTLYSDGHGFCFSCNKPWFPTTWKGKPNDYPAEFKDGFRGIKAAVCETLGVYSYCDADGNVLYREYRAPDGSRWRDVPRKKFWSTGRYPKGLGGTHLFNAGSSHYVTVVEGEEDWAAAFQMLNYGKTTVHPVVYLTSATGYDRKEVHNYLSKFETVKLAIDNDEKGAGAASEIAQMLPNKVRKVSMTKHKDANAYLMAGDDKEWAQAWRNAPIMTVDNVYHTKEDFSTILRDEGTESYYETEFSCLNDVIKGIPTNHVTLITGQEGIGKTEVIRTLEYDALALGKKIAVLHFEETKKTTLKALAGVSMNKNTRDPDNLIPDEEIEKELKDITENNENLFLFEFKNEPTVDMVLSQLKYLVHVCGVEYIFFDPVNQFHPSADESRTDFLDNLSMKVEKFVQDNNVGIVWTAHVNDFGQTRNSRMISKASSIRIDIAREIDANDEVDRNHLWFKVTKNRPFSITGDAGTAYFDVKTMTLSEGWYHQDWYTVDGAVTEPSKKTRVREETGKDESEALGKSKPLPF
jgi:twinkle protein